MTIENSDQENAASDVPVGEPLGSEADTPVPVGEQLQTGLAAFPEDTLEVLEQPVASAAAPAAGIHAEDDSALPNGDAITDLSDVNEVEDVKVILTARTEESHVTMDTNPLNESQEGLYSFDKLDKKKPIVPLPPEEAARINEIAGYFSREYLKDDEEGSRWAQLLATAMRNCYTDGFMQQALQREGSDWRQYLEHEGKKMSIGQVNVMAKPGEKVTGLRAVAHVRAQLNGGTPKQIMMTHSGFWLTMRPAADTSTVDLHRRLATEKIEMGRHSFGQAFSNYSAISHGAIQEYLEEMVYDTTIKGDIPAIGDIMLITDMPLLAAGGASANWPNGFNYSRAVLNNSGEKMTSRQGVVAVNKMVITDNRAFTPWQTAHMANRHGRSMTLEDLEKYRSEFTAGKSRMIELNENISIEFKVPTVNEYLNSGTRWVNGIALMVDKAFALPPTDDARNNFINTQGKATNMRQFAHWIKAIHSGDQVFDEIETIEALLDDMSAMDDVAEKYVKEVRKYIADATVSMVAIPVEEGEAADPMHTARFPHMLPIDAMYTFFTLLVQRVEQIMARK